MPETFTGLVEIQTAGEVTTVTLDGGSAAVTVGSGDEHGLVVVQDAGGTERIRLDARAGRATVHDDAGSPVVELLGDNRSVVVRNPDGRDVVELDGNEARVRVGAEGNEGDIEVVDGGGRSVFHVDGNNAWLRIGAEGNEGDVEVVDGQGRRVFHFNAANAWLRVGDDGNEGDIALVDDAGDTTIHLNGGTGDIILRNADTAEDFEVADLDLVNAGTVMVIDGDGRLRRSSRAYDRRVAGVISGAGTERPGIVLGRDGTSAGCLPLALSGRVYCKVDAHQDPIEVGDLLTTSRTAGHAMRAGDGQRAFGAVIGKALERVESGTALIPILVALQ